MLKDITSQKKQDTEDIIKELSDKEAKERAKTRLDCLKTFDGFQAFSFYYELLMSNESVYRRTKCKELIDKRNRLIFDRLKLEKASETANLEEAKKIDKKLRAINREITLLNKRRIFIGEATFEELLKDLQDEYQGVRVNEIKAIEETPITKRDEVVYGILSNANGTQKLQSFMVKIEEAKKKRKNIRAKLILPKGSYPYLDQKLQNKCDIEHRNADVDLEDIYAFSADIKDAEDLYFNTLMMLKYFDQDSIARLLAMDITDYKDIRRAMIQYREFIDENLFDIYVNVYKRYSNTAGKLFANKKECDELEARLRKLGKLILKSIKDALVEIYKEIESYFGYKKSVVPLTLEGIFQLNGALRTRTEEAYEYTTEIKIALREAEKSIRTKAQEIDDKISEIYGNMSAMSGVDIKGEIAPVKFCEYTSIYRKVCNHKILQEIDEEVNAELSKHNVTKIGGEPYKKKPKES